jgi:hypothetical protein
MITDFSKNDRRRKIERRRHYLTIHFSERRSGIERRKLKDQRTGGLTKRTIVKERKMRFS